MNRTRKRILGQIFWCTALIAGSVAVAGIWSAPRDESTARRTTRSIVRYVSGAEQSHRLHDPTGLLRAGAPVFLAQGDGTFRQVGTVADSGAGAAGESPAATPQPNPDRSEIRIAWYAEQVSPRRCQFFQYHSSGRLSEVVEIMMPPEKRERIRQRIAVAAADHGEELSAAFVPLVEESLKRSLPVIEAEFGRAVRRHREEIDAAVGRWNKEIVEQRLIPLARQEILPIVKEHGGPPAEKIGREIWNRASLFRFGWRAIYDQTPLPKRDLVKEEWQRFVRDDVLPVMEANMDEVVVAIQRSVQDVATNEVIREELGQVAAEVAADPQSRQLVQTILKETIVDNRQLREVWAEVWSSNQAEAAFDLAGDRLDPIVRQIGDEIFGSRESGIDPNFARVLRSQILRKDRQWIVAWHTGAGNGVVQPASRPMPFPVVYLAR